LHSLGAGAGKRKTNHKMNEDIRDELETADISAIMKNVRING
jgi:hypothetical protein